MAPIKVRPCGTGGGKVRCGGRPAHESGGKNDSGRPVKVDLAVVAEGYLASQLIGNSFPNDRDEEIASLGDIVIDQTKSFRNTSDRRISRLGWPLVAVPRDSLRIDDTGERIEMPDASKEELSKLTRDL